MESFGGFSLKEKKHILKMILVRIAVYGVSFFVLMSGAVYFMQGSLVFVPTVGIPQKTPVNLNLEFEDLMLDSGGEKIHAWYIPAADSKATVLFCHGNAGNLGHRMSTIKIWNNVGVNVMIFDYQGYGKSSGSPSEDACYSDVKVCYDWLHENEKVHGPLIVHGRSLGAGPACWAAENLKFDGIILESTFTSVAEMGSHQYPFLPVGLICQINFNNRQRLEASEIPALIFHGRDDEFIPYFMGQELARAAGVKLHELQGSHNSGFEITPDYPGRLNEFISSLKEVRTGN